MLPIQASATDNSVLTVPTTVNQSGGSFQVQNDAKSGIWPFGEGSAQGNYLVALIPLVVVALIAFVILRRK